MIHSRQFLDYFRYLKDNGKPIDLDELFKKYHNSYINIWKITKAYNIVYRKHPIEDIKYGCTYLKLKLRNDNIVKSYKTLFFQILAFPISEDGNAIADFPSLIYDSDITPMQYYLHEPLILGKDNMPVGIKMSGEFHQEGKLYRFGSITLSSYAIFSINIYAITPESINFIRRLATEYISTPGYTKLCTWVQWDGVFNIRNIRKGNVYLYNPPNLMLLLADDMESGKIVIESENLYADAETQCENLLNAELNYTNHEDTNHEDETTRSEYDDKSCQTISDEISNNTLVVKEENSQMNDLRNRLSLEIEVMSITRTLTRQIGAYGVISDQVYDNFSGHWD